MEKELSKKPVGTIRRLPHRNRENIKEHSIFIALLASIIGILATFWSFSHNAILSYGDAEAHLNIAKKVVSALTPGMPQIGGVWLPLPHLLMIPFVINDALWKTGLAGSIVSVTAFAFGAVMLYRLAFLVTKNKAASYLAPLAFITNPNTIYLATTPMTEILLFSCVAASVYYFIRWLTTQSLGALIASSFFVFLASLTRYDGWFLVCIEAFIIFIYTFFLSRRDLKKAEGITMMFCFLGFFGIALWLFWNVIIFGDMFFFLKGIYSSSIQQGWFLSHGYLPTYHNILLSIKYYFTDTVDNIGKVGIVLLILGIFLYVLSLIRHFSFKMLFPLLILLFPFAFYVISLYTGQASLILPEYITKAYKWDYSNVRYGIQMILPYAILLAFLGYKLGPAKILLFILLFGQNIYLLETNNVISYKDGTIGLSAASISKGPDAAPTEKWLATHYDNGLVLMDDYRKPVSLVNDGIPMKAYITSGTKPYWDESLQDPTRWAKWIILQKADTDSVYTGLAHKDVLMDKYSNIYRSGTIFVYRLRQTTPNFVQKQGAQLDLNNHPFVMNGVNIYDLAQTPQPVIASTITALHDADVNTIRLWGFNKNGGFTSDDFANLDYALNQMKLANIHAVITLGNNWNDFGGTVHFDGTSLNQDTSFYTDTDAQVQFEHHVNLLVTHVNTITKIAYKNDPTILSWELLNEPRIENDSSNKELVSWVDTIGSFLAQQDSNHLISIGLEGFLNAKTTGAYHESHGADFSAICSDPIIDICSAHLYPKYLHAPYTQTSIDSIIGQWVSIAKNNNKPFFLGEVGYDLHTDPKLATAYSNRQDFIANVKTVMVRKRMSGGLLWNLAQTSDAYFSLSLTNPQDVKVITTWVQPVLIPGMQSNYLP